jgi:hypothetical protein
MCVHVCVCVLYLHYVGACRSKENRKQADWDCRDGPVHVLLARYNSIEKDVTLWSEPVHQIRATYYVDPWNQGMFVPCGFCFVIPYDELIFDWWL